jgi:hypothetical protein
MFFVLIIYLAATLESRKTGFMDKVLQAGMEKTALKERNSRDLLESPPVRQQ